MKRVEVDAYQDRMHPAGGYAVIRVHGVEGLPEDASFVLKPADPTEAGTDLSRWPDGPRLPLEVRATSQGLELVVGPDLVDSPVLLPGTAVVVELPALAVGGEFVWPTVAPQARPRRRTLIGSRSAVAQDEGQVAGAGVVAETSTPAPARESSVQSARPNADEASARADHAVAPTTPPEPAQQVGEPLAVPQAAAASHSSMWPAQSQLFAAAVGAGLLALMAFATDAIWPGWRPASQQASSASAAGPALDTTGTTSLYDALRAAPNSPRGRAGDGVSASRALELADASLFAPDGARDTDEAAYWMKRFLASEFGTERGRRVLAQLGTTFASPSRGAPDFAAARQLWEISAAFGDPQAMCFLALLHGRGLGEPRSPQLAELWQRRSEAAGGCNRPPAPSATK